jgi:hypothetical protein
VLVHFLAALVELALMVLVAVEAVEELVLQIKVV